jgi:hypothetical protein
MVLSLVASGVAGILVLVFANQLGETGGKILGTSLTVALSAGCAIACGAQVDRRRFVGLGLLGMLLAAAAGAMFIVELWFNFESMLGSTPTLASLWTLAIAAALACLAGLAALPPRLDPLLWSFWASLGITTALIIGVYHDMLPQDGATGRLIGIGAIIAAVTLVLLPIYHWRNRLEGDSAQNQSPIETACPHCGTRTVGLPATLQCPTCDCQFAVTIIRPGFNPGRPDP